ncbi:DnaJ domain-containing protein [bacterium]|nr:DnaJ domain-containing protein [bacterium]
MNYNKNNSKNHSAVLGVAADAGLDDIRAAYLRKVKEHPPDRSPVEFERIREAYEILRNPKYRILQLIQSTERRMSFTSLLEKNRTKRNFVGPKLWLEVLKKKK